MSTASADARHAPRRGARGAISRLPSGSLRVRVYAGIHPVTGRQRYLSHTVPGGPTALADAETAARRLVDQSRDHRRPRTDLTLAELLDRHVDLVHATGTTRRSYRHTVAKHLQPRLGHLKLAAVTPEVLDYLYAALRRCRDQCDGRQGGRPPGDGHHCRPLQPGTIRKIHYLLSGAYRRAVRWGWIDRNPAADAAPPCVPHPEPQPPTPAEAARILTAAWSDPDLGPLVWLAMATGARRGELCALRWRHVDLTRRVLVIRTSIAQSGSATYEKDTKLHQRRHIALDPQTTAMLTAYQQQRQHRAEQAGAALTDEGFVFSPRADTTTHLVPDALSRQYQHLVTGLEIRTTLHKLRHYSATELITAGVDLRTVAGRLGHADNGRTTLRYYTAWVNEADQRASHVLMHRLPVPRAPMATTPVLTSRPASQYQTIAAELHTALGDGTLLPGPNLPIVAAARCHPTMSRPAPLIAPSRCLPMNTSSRSPAAAAPSPRQHTMRRDPQLQLLTVFPSAGRAWLVAAADLHHLHPWSALSHRPGAGAVAHQLRQKPRHVVRA